MNHTTVADLNAMTDAQFLSHLYEFPYQSRWQNDDAWYAAQYRLARINGDRYQQTGKLSGLFNRREVSI